MQANKALQGAAAQAALAKAAAKSVANVILADPGQQSNSAVVLSIAPLLGADTAVDRSHPRWLHVHVRPPVRGLLKLLKVQQKRAASLCIAEVVQASMRRLLKPYSIWHYVQHHYSAAKQAQISSVRASDVCAKASVQACTS